VEASRTSRAVQTSGEARSKTKGSEMTQSGDEREIKKDTQIARGIRKRRQYVADNLLSLYELLQSDQPTAENTYTLRASQLKILEARDLLLLLIIAEF